MAELRQHRAVIRLIALALALLLAAPPSHAQEAPSALYERPVLVLDPGVHTAAIIRADVDAAGRLAVTGSDDRTVRVWSAEDGRLLRTIRLPQGPGYIGKVFAVAISPDGAVIAAGGWTSDTPDPEQVYLFDATTGEMLHRIEGLPNVVNHLAFSSDGRRLAATLGGGSGLRLYDRESGWTGIAADADYGDASYGAAFAPDGRLATTSYDGKLRLYDPDGRLLRSAESGGARPFGLAFSPDGTRLAVGFDDSTAVRLFDGRSLAPLPGPDVSGLDNGNVFKVAWSTDGATLFAGGQYADGAGGFPVIVWREAGRGPRRALPAGRNTIMSLRPLPGGDLLVAAQDPWLSRTGLDGAARWSAEPQQMDPRGQRSSLGLSPDGGVVDFGYGYEGEGRARFDLATLTLSADPPEDGRTAAPKQQGLTVTDWQSRYEPRLDGKPLPLERYEMSRSLAIDAEGERFLLGADWSLRAFDAAGVELWRRPAPGVVWAVNISGDGRLGLAAYGDGTLRWHRMEDGAEILAFFPFNDGSGRWVAWTPEGYYAAAPGASEALGWAVNRGWDAPAEFFPVSSVKGFYKREAIKLVLSERETARAIGLAEIAADRERVQEAVQSAAPPGAQLHVLAIGVSDYANHKHLKLDFADDDAEDLAKALKTQEGTLYARVNSQVLVNGAASRREVLRGLRNLGEAVRGEQGDVVVIHFSGHGALVGDRYYLLPSDVEMDDEVALEDTAIPISALRDRLAELGASAKVVVVLDACHSGSMAEGSKAGALPPDIEAVRAALAETGSGVIVLTSSSGRELSVEKLDWENGAFTEAVLEALAGKGDADADDWLTASELQAHVARRVRELTANKQTPQLEVQGAGYFNTDLFYAGG